MNKGKNRIIVNTSPWIALSICGQNHLLKMLKRIDNKEATKTSATDTGLTNGTGED